jgi:hypothetical protein
LLPSVSENASGFFAPHQKPPSAAFPDEPELRNPITGITGDCARAQSGRRRAAEKRDELAAFHWQCLLCFRTKDSTPQYGRRLLRCGISVRPMAALGHFRLSSAGFAYRPLPLSPKSGHSASARFYEYTPLALQVIGEDSDLYGLAEALRLDCCF